MNTYIPSPASLDDVQMTSLMIAMRNSIAENAHNNWLNTRLAEGGTIEKYPNLKPWDELTDEQKISALDQAEQTVKLVQKLFGLDNILSGKVSREEIVDAIARNAHEVWAKQRMDAGWTYAPVRDNEKKHHPMLIPYEELPESEKEYDRAYGDEFYHSFEEVGKDIDHHLGEGVSAQRDSEAYRLATEAAIFLADNLNRVGIKTVVVGQEEAREAFENERDRIDLSVRDIQGLSYTWNGEEVSLKGFAEQFMGQIKQSDRTIEDAERIAKAFIESVKADPEAAGMKMLKAENMSNAFRFRLPDGSIYSPEHPMAESPEYQTQKALWYIYEQVLGQDEMKEFTSLLSKKTPMTEEERVRYSAMESRVNASDLMQRSLEVPASKVNENRVKDIRNLIQYFEENNDYTWTEKALIVKGSMTYGFSEKKVDGETQVDVKNISDNNSVAVPVIGGEAAAVVEGLRKGLNFKESLKQARIELSKTTTRSVPRNFTGWKVYKQSHREEDAVILNRDAAGTGWCTGNAVSTARSHLSGGDFHIYFEGGEPLIAVRTQDGYMAEPPRGAHEGQFCTRREEDIAFDYILGNRDIVAGDDYIADIKDIRKIMSPEATALDAFVFNEERRYKNGEFGGNTRAWGKAVEDRVKSLLIEDVDERHAQGLYRSEEIDWNDKEALKNIRAIIGYVIIPDGFHGELSNCLYIRDYITVGRSSKFSISNVLETGGIEVRENGSLSLPKAQKTGPIIVYENGSLSAPEVQKTRFITVHENSSLLLPNVRETLSIEVLKNGSLSLPNVRETSDIYVRVNGSLSAPEVQKTGFITVHENGSLSIPKVQKTGGIFVSENGSLSIPKVQKTGRITVLKNGSLSAPEVQETGDIEVHENGEMILPDGTNLKEGIYPVSEILKHLDINQQKEEFSYSDGTVYGYQVDDTIYLTHEGINPNTPIHEYTHIWAKAYQRLYPAEWDALKEELKQHSMWGLVAASPEYEHIVANEDRLAGEVLAHIVGNSGEDLLVSAAEGAKTKEEVIANFRERISSFAMEEVFGLKSSANYEKLTMKVLNDFVSGRNPQDGIEFSVSNTGRRRERSGEAKTPRKENQNLYQTAAVEFSQMTSVPKSVKIYRPYKLDSYAMEGAKQICDELIRRVNIASSIDDLISIREEMESRGLLLNGHRFIIDREKGLFSYSESGEKRGQDFLVSYSAKENESHEHAEKAALQQLKNGLSLVVNTLAIDCDRELTKAKEDDRKRNKRIDFFLGMPTFLALIVGMLYIMGYGLLTATTGGVFPVLDFMVRRARNLNRHARRPFNVSKRRTPIEQFNRRRESLQRSLEKNISKNVTIIDRATDKPKEETASQEKAAEETKQKVEEEKKQKVEEKKEVETDIERNADGSPRVRTADEGEETGRRPLSEITPTDEQVRIREERLREAEKDSEQEEVAGRSEGEDFVMSNLAACVTPESFKAEMERLEEAFNNGKTVYDKELNAILTKADFAMTRPAYIARSVQEIQTKYNSFIERIEAEYKTLKNYEGILGEESTFRSTFQDALGRIGPCSGEASQIEQMKKELADVSAAVDVLVSKTRLEVDGRERNEAEARLFFNGKTPTESDYREMANVAMKEAMERVASAPSVSCVAQRVNGEIIAGPSQILLQGHMLSNGYSLPVYLTAGDIAKYHLNVMGDGVLTYFNDRPDGAGIKGVRLYNIDETDFRFRNPEVYNRLVGEMAELRDQVRGNNLMTSPKMNTYKTRVRNLASRVMQKMAAAMLTWSEEPSSVEYQGNEAQSCMAETVKSISTTDSYFNAATQVAEKLLSARAAKLSMSSDPKKGVDFASMEEKACESVQQEEKEKVRMEEQEVAIQAGEMAK